MGRSGPASDATRRTWLEETKEEGKKGATEEEKETTKEELAHGRPRQTQ